MVETLGFIKTDSARKPFDTREGIDEDELRRDLTKMTRFRKRSPGKGLENGGFGDRMMWLQKEQ